jgi:hypothetical protein
LLAEKEFKDGWFVCFRLISCAVDEKMADPFAAHCLASYTKNAELDSDLLDRISSLFSESLVKTNTYVLIAMEALGILLNQNGTYCSVCEYLLWV